MASVDHTRISIYGWSVVQISLQYFSILDIPAEVFGRDATAYTEQQKNLQ